MSLFNRLMWYTFFLLLSVLSFTTVVVSQWTLASFEDRLTVQAENSIGALARAMSVLDLSKAIDLDRSCTLLSTVPDTLEFRSVELLDEVGDQRCFHINTPSEPRAPGWFIDSIEMEIVSVSQPVQQDWVTWELMGTPYEANAYDELWKLAVNTFWGVLLLFTCAGVIGFWTLQTLLDPLREVVLQAKNIGERRFTKITIPSTTEFADVARSMNNLSERIQSMLSDEAALLKDKKASSDLDDVTGLLNRETFIDQFNARLSRENEESVGSVALIRLLKLSDMNREYGREVIDNLLKDIGDALNQLSTVEYYGSYCSLGRLNGSDICAIATNESNAKNLADTLQRHVAKILTQHNIDKQYSVAAACIDYEMGDNPGELLSSMDDALAQSELQSGVPIVPAQRRLKGDANRINREFWQENLSSALENGSLRLDWFPARRKDKSVLHLEGMARIKINDQDFTASAFMPWVFRLGLGKAFDKAVVTEALKTLPQRAERLHVNLSAESLKGIEFSSWLNEQLATSSADIARFGAEISETAIIGAQSSFENLMSVLKTHGGQLGIDHMGYRPEIIVDLGRLGPSYLKIDSLYTQNLRENEGNQAVVNSFSGVARSLGIDSIVEGVTALGDRDAAFNIGVKGVSGPAID